jgi:hypothetical protein
LTKAALPAALLFSHPLVFCFELPGILEGVDQRFKGLVAGLEREKATIGTAGCRARLEHDLAPLLSTLSVLNQIMMRPSRSSLYGS